MKKQKRECKHRWFGTVLIGYKYLYRICAECGQPQRAKLNWRDYKNA